MVQFEDADTDDIIRIKTILSSLMILEMLSHDVTQQQETAYF